MVLQKTLEQWLSYCESIHPVTIDMGLDRVRSVWQRMNCALDKGTVVFTVGGTNGKGSTCKYLEQIVLHAGYTVGMYTSPHLIDFNERISIQGQPVGETDLCESFEAVERARVLSPAISLSYFEIVTLVALHRFAVSKVEVVVLEVGLGGRLDAVNIIDADCSIVTSVDLDHQSYLGNTRELIAFEKAHIYRKGKPAICADPQPPQSLIDYAQACGADLWLLGRDFNYSGDRQQWGWAGRGVRRSALAYPALRGANQLLNASGALAALQSVKALLPVTAAAIRQGLMYATLAGRFQILPGQPPVILDVAHNPHAAAVLAQNLDAMGFYPTTHAVFAALSDKDIQLMVNVMKSRVDVWHLVPLQSERSLPVDQLKQYLSDAGIADKSIHLYDAVGSALDAAMKACTVNSAQQSDRVVVFGSFLTVAASLKHISTSN